jgi:hypothetical protein
MRSNVHAPAADTTGDTPFSGAQSGALPTALPTAPCSVVWSRGHSYVLEPVSGRPRWLGVDDKGRAEELSCADLQRRGWTRTCKR